MKSDRPGSLKRLACLFLVLTIIGCNSQEDATRLRAQKFFDLYKQRTDWEAFQNLYAEDAIFEDVVFRYRYNKEEFITFYNWPDPLLKKHPDYPEVMVLEDLVVTGNLAVGKGYFTPFYYGDILYDSEYMRFTMWLAFDDDGLITKHIDWIEYPPEFVISAMNRHMASDSIPD